MQRVVLVLVGIMLVSFGLAALFGVFLPGAGMGIVSEDINSEEVFTAAGLERMVVETVSTKVFLIPVDGEEITVHFHGWARGSAGSMPELRAVKTADSLRINIDYPMNVNFLSTRELRLDIYIPKDYSGELSVQTVSGSVEVADLDLRKFRFKSVSGGLRAENFSAQEGIYESTSGKISVRGLAGQARVNTVSGNILLAYKEFAHDIDIKSTSGDARVELPEESEFSLSARTVSGKVNTGFPITLEGDSRNVTGVVGSGEHRITTSTVSGDILIQPVR